MLQLLINRCLNMLQNILQKSPSNEQAYRLKYNHLQSENAALLLTVQDLQRQIQSLRVVNEQLLHKSPKSIQILIQQLSRQNEHLEKSLFRLLKNNEQLSCDILMKNQLICEAERQFRDIVSSFQEKIYEMRVSIQNKEIAVTYIEQKGHDDKEQPYGSSTRVNLMYFNQMSELKLMIDRISVENSQLRLLNCIKDEEIEKGKALIDKYDKLMDKREDLKVYRDTLQAQGNQKTTRKLQAKNKLQEQLTRYDMKYKHLSTTKNLHTPNQINSLKMMLTQLNKQNRNIRAEKTKLQNQLAIKIKEYGILQQGYKMVKEELMANRIEIQFYRQNFKQLCKVPTQRKIKFYGEYYQEILPTLEKKLHERQNLISYWKHWRQNNEQQLAKCIMPKLKPLRRTAKRSNSCACRYSYFKETAKKVCMDKNKEETIFNFINETHNVNSMINHTIEVEHNPNKAEQMFNDDISIIIKPKVKQAQSWKKRKPEMI